LGISFICWFRVIRVFFHVFAIFIVTDGVEDKGSGDTTFDVQTLGDLFEHVTEICLVHDEVFSGKRQNFWSWEYSPQVPD